MLELVGAYRTIAEGASHLEPRSGERLCLPPSDQVSGLGYHCRTLSIAIRIATV